MPKSLIVDHLEVALRLAKSDGKFLACYFIEMAVDAARRADVTTEIDARSVKKRI